MLVTNIISVGIDTQILKKWPCWIYSRASLIKSVEGNSEAGEFINMRQARLETEGFEDVQGKQILSACQQLSLVGTP